MKTQTQQERTKRQIEIFLRYKLRETERREQPPAHYQEDQFDPFYELFLDRHPRLDRIK